MIFVCLWVWVLCDVQRQQAVVEAQFKQRRQMQTQVVQQQPTPPTSSGAGGGSGLDREKYAPSHRPAPHSAAKPSPSGPSPATQSHEPIEESFTYASLPGIEKLCLGIPSRVYGDSDLIILSKEELQMLEDALPIDMQVVLSLIHIPCYAALMSCADSL
jgi:hypothetical protein